MALTKEKLYNIKLPLSDEDYAMILGNLRDLPFSLESVSKELALAFDEKAAEIYEARHPGNNLWFEEIPWEPPLTNEEKAILVGHSNNTEDMDDESNNTLTYMGIGYNKSKEREEIEKAGFEIIKDSDGIDRGQWAYELIKAYPHEVIDEFGSDPFEVGGLVEEMWDIDEYEDHDSGLTMRWPDWAVFFSTDVAKTVYEELVVEHQSRLKYEEKAKQLHCTIEQLKSIIDSSF